jgi:hypothetical protein
VQTTERDDLRGQAIVDVVVDLRTFKVPQDGEVVTDRCLLFGADCRSAEAERPTGGSFPRAGRGAAGDCEKTEIF